MLDKPKISICIPTYNRAKYLVETLRTILNQTFTDFELIISDDGSTDDTSELIKCIRDERLKYTRNETNLGLYENWNYCINLAKGDYIAIYHDHDLYESTLVKESVDILDSNKNIGFIFSGIRYIDDNGKALQTIVEKHLGGFVSGHKLVRRMATKWNSLIAAPTVMVRKDAYEHAGLYNADLGYGADLDMWVRLLLKYDSYYIARPMVDLRVRTPNCPVSANYSWKDIKGHAKMHLMNIERIYKDNGVRHTWEKIKWLLKRDKEYLKFLAWAVHKKKKPLIDEGQNIIRNQTNICTQAAARILTTCGGDLLLKTGMPVFQFYSQLRLLFLKKFVWK